MTILRALFLALICLLSPGQTGLACSDYEKAQSAFSETALKAFQQALFDRDESAVLAILDGTPIDNVVFSTGETPLHVVVVSPIVEPDAPKRDTERTLSLRLVGALIAAGADPNALNDLGLTPLMALVISSSDTVGEAVLIEALVAHGADLNLQDERGNTALHYAAQLDRETLIDTLTGLPGIDASRRNRYGQTAAELAKEFGHEELAEKLVQ